MAHETHIEGVATPETAPIGNSADRDLDVAEFLQVRLMDGGERVVLVGELCYASVPYADNRLRRIERGDIPIKTLDLGDLSFIDLPGLDLIDAWDARRRRQGRAAEIIPGRHLTRLRGVIQAGRDEAAREQSQQGVSDAVSV
jgi:hypothetical protein